MTVPKDPEIEALLSKSTVQSGFPDLSADISSLTDQKAVELVQMADDAFKKAQLISIAYLWIIGIALIICLTVYNLGLANIRIAFAISVLLIILAFGAVNPVFSPLLKRAKSFANLTIQMHGDALLDLILRYYEIQSGPYDFGSSDSPVRKAAFQAIYRSLLAGDDQLHLSPDAATTLLKVARTCKAHNSPEADFDSQDKLVEQVMRLKDSVFNPKQIAVLEASKSAAR